MYGNLTASFRISKGKLYHPEASSIKFSRIIRYRYGFANLTPATGFPDLIRHLTQRRSEQFPTSCCPGNG